MAASGAAQRAPGARRASCACITTRRSPTPFTGKEPDDVALWPIWDLVACPTLILRGAQSDLLLPETVAEMKTRGAAGTAGKVETAEIAECGHAPALMARDQIALVARFLGA